MQGSLLDASEKIHIQLNSNKEIQKASDPVFEQRHQEEARMMIFESDFLRGYLDEFSTLALMGKPLFAVVTEVGRQTTFRYDHQKGDAILLTRTPRGIEELLSDPAFAQGA